MADPTQDQIDAWHARTGNAPGLFSPLGALSDMITGAARGAAKTTLGWPGDLEHALTPSDSSHLFPTSEQVGNALPDATHFSMPAPAWDANGNLIKGSNPFESVGANLPLSPSQLGSLGRVALRPAAGAVHAAMAGEGPLARALSPVTPMYAVRPKGGNFDAVAPEMYGMQMGEGNELGGRPQATQQWFGKQFQNYLKKQLGTPEDPLLQVEKEYPNLHLPEDAMAEAGPGEALKYEDPERDAVHAQLTGGAPLTPWGKYSGDTLFSMDPQEYKNHLEQYFDQEPQPWLDKAPPDTKIWSIGDRAPTGGDGDPLGFSHVADYLDAAQGAHQHIQDHGAENLRRILEAQVPGPAPAQVPEWRAALGLHSAGLTLSPEQVARTSVADAVRKTAQWNDLMAQGMGGPADPDLARGIVGVHKDYGDGMKWVKLGAPTKQLSDFGPDHYIQDLAQSNPAALPAQLANEGKADLRAGLNAEGKVMGHCVGGYCDDVADRGTSIYSLRDANNNPHVTVEAVPEEGHPELPESIAQIKGKQNAAPVSKYLPYVQDFVKSGNWGRVGDLRNTGLSKIGGKYFSGEELNAARKATMPHVPQSALNSDYFDNLMRSPNADIHPDDAAFLQNLGLQHPNAPLTGNTGYAAGGTVVPRYSKKAQLLALLNAPRVRPYG